MGKYWFKYGVNGYVREITVDAIGEPAAWRIVENILLILYNLYNAYVYF